ncbi:MAG: type II secretion system protein [Proteobacteria bacterium]|nr:type II secretion system protein [Pseudomonadota bacterium]
MRGHKNKGFTTLEIAIVMLVAGALLLIGVTAFEAYGKQARRGTSEQRLEAIMDATAAYAARNYRIPCPADPAGGGPEPFGAERGSGAAGTNIGACVGNLVDGVVPFLTLGLTEEEARDGWGNYITYKVSRAFTYDPEDNATPVHAKCRTTEWIEAGRNVAAQKARFCCTGRDTADDVTICQNTASPCPNQGIWPLSRNTSAPVANGWYETGVGAVDALADPDDAGDAIAFGSADPYHDANFYATNVLDTTNITAIAYAIISHGSDGTGAFNRNGTRRGDTNADGIPDMGGTYERLNGNATQRQAWDLLLVDRPGLPTNFNDMVRFSTQDMLLARIGRDSCAVP